MQIFHWVSSSTCRGVYQQNSSNTNSYDHMETNLSIDIEELLHSDKVFLTLHLTELEELEE